MCNVFCVDEKTNHTEGESALPRYDNKSKFIVFQYLCA